MLVSYTTNILMNHAELLKMVEAPIVIKVNKFDEDSVKLFSDEFNKATSSRQPIVPIVIDSYGGQVDSLLHMVDICRSSKKTIATIVMGKAMSCGAVLTTCGWHGYRFAAPSARIMIHDVSTASFGKTEDIKADAAEVSRLNENIYKIMADNCEKPEKYFWDIVQSRGRADWYMTAEDALSHNFINHIKIPELSIQVNVDYKFG